MDVTPPTRPHSPFTIHQSPFRPAFTLIELLVVISIISVLIALMLPALAKARDQAKGAVCETNISDLGVGMQLYFSEFNGAVPLNGILMPKSGIPQMYQAPGADPRFAKAEDKDQQHWRLEYGVLWKEMGGSDIPNLYADPDPPLPPPDTNMAKKFLCPVDIVEGLHRGNGSSGAGKAPLYYSSPAADGSVQVQVSTGTTVSPGYWSYSVNAVMNSLGRLRDNPVFQKNGATALPWQDPLMVNSIRNTSEFIFFLEEDKNSLFNDEVFEPPTLRDAASNTERLTNRHNGGGYVGFADRHVEWFNEIVFDNGASTNAITRMFFPDNGEFLNAGP